MRDRFARRVAEGRPTPTPISPVTEAELLACDREAQHAARGLGVALLLAAAILLVGGAAFYLWWRA